MVIYKSKKSTEMLQWYHYSKPIPNEDFLEKYIKNQLNETDI